MKIRTRTYLSLATTLLVAAASPTQAAIVSYAPVEEAVDGSKDTWAYQGTNGDFGSAFYAIIPAGNTNNSGHDQQSFIKISVADLGITSSDVVSAKLTLHSTNAPVNFGVPADADHPVVVDLYKNTTDWSETLTWNSRPTTAASPESSTNVNAIGADFDFDVTNLVKDWLTTPSSNNGVTLRMDTYTNGGFATFESSSSAANRPTLFITTVPEPTTFAGLLVCGTTALLRRRRRVESSL